MNSPKGVVERCLLQTSDPFTLVVLAAYRSQELASGIAPCISTDGSKDALVSLKEISSGKLDMHLLEERMIKSLQKFSFLSEDALGDGGPVPKAVPAYENAAIHAHALFQKPAPSSMHESDNRTSSLDEEEDEALEEEEHDEEVDEEEEHDEEVDEEEEHASEKESDKSHADHPL